MTRSALVPLCLAALLCASLTGCREERREDVTANDAKPVLYLYPEKETEVKVRLDYDGELTCTYPACGEEGWTVTAAPDGTLTDAKGQTYNYLYWEGLSDGDYDFSQGFCVPGADTAAFLEKSLAKLGLTRREANEFIVYWLPRMEASAYNLIAFQEEAYTDRAKLAITPTPDSLLRVFMAWRPLTEPVEIPEQDLPAFNRTGFAAVEWGGAELRHLTRQEAEQLIASHRAMTVAEEKTALPLSFRAGGSLQLFYSNEEAVLSASVPLRTAQERRAAEKALGGVTGRAVTSWAIPDDSRPAYGLRYSDSAGSYEAVCLQGLWLDNRGNALLTDADFPAVWKQLAKSPAETAPAAMPCRMELALQNGQWNHWFMTPSSAENPSRDVTMTLAPGGGSLSWTISNRAGIPLSHSNESGVELEVSLAGWWYTVPLARAMTAALHTLPPRESRTYAFAKEYYTDLPDGNYRLVFPLYISSQGPQEMGFFGYAAASFQLKDGAPVLQGR